MQLKRVLFPAPLGPMMLRISPSFTVKETSSTAVNPPNRFVIPSTSSKGAAVISPSFGSR